MEAIQSVHKQHSVPVIGDAVIVVSGYGGTTRDCVDKYTVLDRTVVTGGVEEWQTDGPQHQLTSSQPAEGGQEVEGEVSRGHWEDAIRVMVGRVERYSMAMWSTTPINRSKIVKLLGKAYRVHDAPFE